MKQIFKKMSSVCVALLLSLTVMMAGTVAVYAEDELDDNTKSQLVMTAEGLTETIVPLSQEDIDNYMKSGDDFTENAMTAWTGAKEELGELNELGETAVSYDDGAYIVTVPADFEKADAEFVYMFDETGVPASMSINVKYPMSVTLQRAGMNTLMGIGTVFVMLVFLSFVIYLFKFIPGSSAGKKKAPEAAPAPAVPAAPAVEEVTDDTELIAVIAAAIAASEGTSTDGFVVRSIRKVNRKKW